MHVGQFEVALARVFEALSPAELVNSEVFIFFFSLFRYRSIQLLTTVKTDATLVLPPSFESLLDGGASTAVTSSTSLQAKISPMDRFLILVYPK